MSTPVASNRGVSRIIAKLDAAFVAGNYYEAHQIYKILYFRYVAQKRFAELAELLFKGATRLVAQEQYTSGADLGGLLVDVLDKFQSDSDTIWMQRIGVLLGRIGKETVERETIIAKSIKWSANLAPQTPQGHPMMNKIIARVFLAEGNYEHARHHYLLSKDGVGLGEMLVTMSLKSGYGNETDLFITQIVLQQLCRKDKEIATIIYNTYTRYHPLIGVTEPPFSLPLLNFVFYLFKTIDTKDRSTFTKLCELYKTSLNRDPSYEQYVQKISEVYFGVAPPRGAASNTPGGLFSLFGEMFQGMMAGEEEPRPSAN